MGVDEIILLSDKRFAGSDTWATSLTLAEAIKKIGSYGIVLFGQQAIDGDTAQVGPGVAAHLNIPQTCFVRKICDINETNITVERLMENGFDTVAMELPAIITVVKEINTPRLPSLRGKRVAKSTPLNVWNADDLNLPSEETGLNGSPTQVVKIFSPQLDKDGEKHEVTADEAVELLLKKIKSLKNG